MSVEFCPVGFDRWLISVSRSLLSYLVGTIYLFQNIFPAGFEYFSTRLTHLLIFLLVLKVCRLIFSPGYFFFFFFSIITSRITDFPFFVFLKLAV